jgi:hypothetical protein
VQAYAATAAAGELGWPLWSLCASYDAGERIELGNHSAWRALQGDDISWSDHASKRHKALGRIESLASLCRATGHKGLVLLFDEAETIDQLWNVRSRMSAYSVLGRLSKIQATWSVYGITERFERTVGKDIEYAAGAALLDPAAQNFLRQWRDGQFSIVKPPAIDASCARVLADAVASLYTDAYDIAASDAVVARCLDEWGRNPGRNPRRLVRSLIHELDLIRPLSA